MSIVKINPNDIFGSYKIICRDSTKQTAAIYWICECLYCKEQKSIRSTTIRKNPVCHCQKGKENIGKVFDEWEIMSQLKDRGKDKSILYDCKCLYCGHHEKIAMNVLKSSRKHCPNCYQKKSTLIDMTGKIYGNLKVLERDLSEKHTGHEADSYWLCECLLCGTQKTIRGISLRKGFTKSCGCVKSYGEEFISKLLYKNNISFSKEFTFSDLYYTKEKYKLRFDFAIFNENNQLSHLIEYDGIQHFQEGVRESGWNTQENYLKTIERDRIKNEYCENNKIKLIRIKYNEEITIDKLLGKVKSEGGIYGSQ